MRNRPWAGLDIGAHSVKLMALSPGASRGHLAEVPLPRPLAGDEAPPSAAIAALIGLALERLGHTPRSVAGFSVGVSGPDVIVKQVSLPLMDEAEIPGALRFEARKLLPFDPQTLVLDHQVITRHAGEKRLDVLFATVSQPRLDRALAPLRELGVEAAIVDAAPLALSNALWSTLPRDAAEAHVSLDLGHRGAWLVYRHRQSPFFARRLDWGGQALLQALTNAHGGDVEAAERWLAAPETSAGEASAAGVVVRDAIARLVEEVRLSLAFYSTTASLPDKVILHVSGGVARLPGLVDLLGHQLGTPARLFGPLSADTRATHPAPSFALAMGLALRNV